MIHRTRRPLAALLPFTLAASLALAEGEPPSPAREGIPTLVPTREPARDTAPREPVREGTTREPAPAAGSAREGGSREGTLPTPASTGQAPKGEESAWRARKSGWHTLSAAEKSALEAYSADYRRFLHDARTELTTIAEVRKRAEARGFKAYAGGRVKAGDRLYFNNRDRAMLLVRVGSQPLTEGIRLIGTHVDSPRLELKGRPFYQSQELVLLQTGYHGGIKKYQWVDVPLALLGRIHRADGSYADVRLGLEADEPVLSIPDMAPHEDKEYRERKQGEVVKGEELDPVIASIPADGGSPLAAVFSRIKEQYRVQEEDFASAELQLVPAFPPREVGIDRSLIGAYGQDDRSCTFAAVRALLDMDETPPYTVVVLLADNEETGSQNNTGADSLYLREVYQTLIDATRTEGKGAPDSPAVLYQVLRKTLAVSADTNTGVNPTFAGTHEESNSSRLGFGVAIKLYGRGEGPLPETVALFRRIFTQQGIPWTTHTPKIDVAGGGTIGGFLSRQGMDVIDLGIPLLAMHSPFELASKVDLYALYRTLSAFAKGAPR